MQIHQSNVQNIEAVYKFQDNFLPSNLKPQSIGVQVISPRTLDLQIPCALHHRLDLLPLDVDDLPLVKPVPDRVRVAEVRWGLLPLRVRYAYEVAVFLPSFQTLHFVS